MKKQQDIRPTDMKKTKTYFVYKTVINESQNNRGSLVNKIRRSVNGSHLLKSVYAGKWGYVYELKEFSRCTKKNGELKSGYVNCVRINIVWINQGGTNKWQTNKQRSYWKESGFVICGRCKEYRMIIMDWMRMIYNE